MLSSDSLSRIPSSVAYWKARSSLQRRIKCLTSEAIARISFSPIGLRLSQIFGE